jgi:hypothetical protein
LKAWCAEQGIDIQSTAPYSPEQHGIAKQLNCTLIELAHTMLIALDLPPFLWAEAVKYASYIRNHVATRTLTDHTPYEACTRQKPNIAHLHEFRCDVWILYMGDRSKLDPKANKFMVVGFEDGPCAVRYYSPTTRRIQVSRDFTFEESKGSDASFVEFGIRELVETSVPSVKPAMSEGESTKEDTHIVSVRTKKNSATVHNMGLRMKREDHGVNLRLRFRVKEGSSDRENVLSKQGCSNREK